MGRLFEVKRLEELLPGNTFSDADNYFIVTSDYRSRKTGRDLCCVNLKTGNIKWISAAEFVEVDPIYILDKENNIVPLKKTEKENV